MHARRNQIKPLPFKLILLNYKEFIQQIYVDR